MTEIEIPYGHQSVDDDDIAAVVEVLRGNWLTQGPAVERFETALGAATGAEHAVAFANGTVALHASLWAT
jgi:perosamine synthetase